MNSVLELTVGSSSKEKPMVKRVLTMACIYQRSFGRGEKHAQDITQERTRRFEADLGPIEAVERFQEKIERARIKII